ncbi:MAG: hypothetical protein K2F57_05635 [Candidatus Gastranaerophilales bacterium]|nr:hypothetical protein [Candidatus Gastranaerophilales bacterium]
MLRNRLLVFSMVLGLTAVPVFAENLSDLEFPKSPAYRVGISELPEKQYVQALEDKKTEKKFAQINNSQEDNIADLTYADLSIKRLSKEVAQDLEFEEQDMLSDLSLLWQGAAVQSDTINFALYKLANPDADKPDEKSVKNVLKTIASMSTLVGASMGSPILAGSSLIGGNIFNIFAQDTKALNYKYTRVNDADMIILIRKVEDLQQKAVDLYYDYMSAKKNLEFSNDLVKENQRKFELAQENNAARELVVITDAYYRTALDKQRTAKSEFFSKRAALEQFVGNEAFVQFESELAARENGEPKPVRTEAQQDINAQNQEYSETIQNVENYTNNIEPSAINGDENSEPEASQEEENIAFNEDLVEEVMTGSSSNIEEETENKKNGIFKRNKNAKVKESKNSTKGLIFLHNNEEVTQEKSERKKRASKSEQVQTVDVQQVQKPVVDTLGLPPLDEIKVPELTRGGYSIHSYYDGDENNGDPSLSY